MLNLYHQEIQKECLVHHLGVCANSAHVKQVVAEIYRQHPQSTIVSSAVEIAICIYIHKGIFT
jgi:hypothetical protein